jgi:energy-converting hydrogenase Eha subunit A
MRKGMLIGAIVGFLGGYALQSHGFTTGMAALSFGGNSDKIIGYSVVASLFVASLCGVICAFLGELIDELLERQKN